MLSRPLLAKFIRNSDSNALFDNVDNGPSKYSPLSFVDAPTRSYIDEVDRRIRPWFATEYHEMKYKKCDYLVYLNDVSLEILKGKYVIASDEEYIQLGGNSNIPLSYVSSGQQEVVWLLNTLKYYAYFEQECFIVVEEPEAHLSNITLSTELFAKLSDSI